MVGVQKNCGEYQCMSETHLCNGATDSFCPSSHIVAAR